MTLDNRKKKLLVPVEPTLLLPLFQLYYKEFDRFSKNLFSSCPLTRSFSRSMFSFAFFASFVVLRKKVQESAVR